MSVESMAIALHHSRAKGTAKLILLGIANHDGDGGAWPSVATLKRYAGITERSNVQKALRALEELGEIKRHIQAGGTADMVNALRPNYYEFLLSCPDYCDRSRNHRDMRKPLISYEETLEIDPASNTTPGVVNDAPPASPATPKPSLKPITELKKEPHVLNRVRECRFDENTGWCLTCVHPAHRLEQAS